MTAIGKKRSLRTASLRKKKATTTTNNNKKMAMVEILSKYNEDVKKISQNIIKKKKTKLKHVKFGFRFNSFHAKISFYIVPVLLTLAGLIFIKNHESQYIFYETLAILSCVLCTSVLLLCGIWEILSYYLASPVPGHRLQFKKKDPPMYVKESIETVVCIYIVACFMTWPITQIRLGQTTAFKDTLKECVPTLFESFPIIAYLVKVFLTLLIADTHTFWKHYFLHNPTFYVFHKSHHKFHNPSTFACFAIHPVEAVWTFWPILLICVPELFFKGFMGLYLPVHLPFLGFFSLLNLYLHCGYSVPFLEWLLPKLWINTSK